MPLLYLVIMSLVQFVLVYNIYPEYESGVFLFGNLQIIATLFVWKIINKYIKVWYESLQTSKTSKKNV